MRTSLDKIRCKCAAEGEGHHESFASVREQRISCVSARDRMVFSRGVVVDENAHRWTMLRTSGS